MASKRRNMFHKNKTQETTEIVTKDHYFGLDAIFSLERLRTVVAQATEKYERTEINIPYGRGLVTAARCLQMAGTSRVPPPRGGSPPELPARAIVGSDCLSVSVGGRVHPLRRLGVTGTRLSSTARVTTAFEDLVRTDILPQKDGKLRVPISVVSRFFLELRVILVP
ncbi:hypothetical protein AAG570_002587 [Ranatra chinensis]|uniref:Uncharacterized protein n=1 Tax=Ranatra chinensis TaxID=642074 RepID=A0ABD0YWG4_9HEMI